MCEHGFGKKQVSSCSTVPSCGRSISTMLAQKCKNRAAGCYRAMTAKEGMSHRLLEASQHSRSRNYDRKSDIPEPDSSWPGGARSSQKEPGGARRSREEPRARIAVSPCSTAPSCGRNISTMLAQNCKNGAAGCYRAMTAKEGMSHRLLEASQHSRGHNCDRKSDIPEPA